MNDVQFGKTLDWKMKQINIEDFYELQRKSCFKLISALLNNSDGNAASILLTKDRFIRFLSENKCGHMVDNIGWSFISQHSFIYQMRIHYN